MDALSSRKAGIQSKESSLLVILCSFLLSERPIPSQEGFLHAAETKVRPIYGR